MRAAISLVTVCSGDIITISAQNTMAASVPTASDLPDWRSHLKSPVASANPTPMIGSISGDSSMAPITTAGEDNSRPRMAMPADIDTISR